MTDNPHRGCTRTACQLVGFTESGGGTYVSSGESRRYFPGCPMSYITPDVNRWMSSYRWLKMGKTPVELGIVSPDEMDPRWYQAMELIDSEIARIQEDSMPKKRHG